jgi:hypothetical protein
VDTQGAVQHYDLASESFGGPLINAFGTSHLQTSQGDDFWVGDGYDLTRKTLAGASVATVKVSGTGPPTPLTTDLFSANAAAFDGTRLWIHGYNFSLQRQELWKVNEAGDAIETKKVMDFDVAALAWDGSSLWAILGFGDPAVFKIDPATLQVTATYTSPIHGVTWQGIASDGTDLYLLATTNGSGTSTAKILKVRP